MDKRQQLLGIIQTAQLPEKAEQLLVEEVKKQTDITDDFIMTVADTLDRIGLYMQAAGEMQADYFDSVIENAAKMHGIDQVLGSIQEQLQEPRESLQMFTASAKPA